MLHFNGPVLKQWFKMYLKWQVRKLFIAYFIEGPCIHTWLSSSSPKISVNMPVLLSSTGYFKYQSPKIISIQGLTEGYDQVRQHLWIVCVDVSCLCFGVLLNICLPSWKKNVPNLTVPPAKPLENVPDVHTPVPFCFIEAQKVVVVLVLTKHTFS